MTLEQNYSSGNKHYHVVYRDCDTFADLPYEKIRQHYGVCRDAIHGVSCP